MTLEEIIAEWSQPNGPGSKKESKWKTTERVISFVFFLMIKILAAFFVVMGLILLTFLKVIRDFK